MNLPEEFILYNQQKLNDEWQAFANALHSEPPVSIRLNKYKCDQSNVLSSISDTVPWCSTGYYLPSRPQFTFDPLFHAGYYYVQEASSMFIEQIFKQYINNSVRVLDLCAAPGGKSTLISSLIDDDSILISNEVIRSRANILVENMTKWGAPNVVVTNNTPSDIGNAMDSFFDVILVDAPCSGEGMFRKDVRAIEEWSLDNVKLCKKRQQAILSDVWSSLKPGGILIYSTCTYNIEENEENVLWIKNELGGDIMPIAVEKEWNIRESFIDGIDTYRFFPHKTKGEGFFCSVIRKAENKEYQYSSSKKKKNKKSGKSTKKIPLIDDLKCYLTHEDLFTFSERSGSYIAYSAKLTPEFLEIESSLNVLSQGILLGEYKNQDFIPNQSLALSNYLNKEIFSKLEVDWTTAIKYLKKEPIDIPSYISKGYILIMYKGTAIGFVKNIGSRSNNLYPSMWRIRSNNVPINEVVIV